jgi:hypothetical protein
LGLGSSAFRYDARPGGGVADPPEDLGCGVVVFEVLRVDRCLEAKVLAVNMCGWVYSSLIFETWVYGSFSLKNNSNQSEVVGGTRVH